MPRKEQVAAALRYLGDKADLKRRYERLTSLDQPQDADALDMALEMGGSMVPGVGQALAARDFERARRADDKAGMAMAGASALPFGRLAGALKQYDPTMQKIFIGKSAKTWDAAAAEKAQNLEKAGFTPEAIWKKTGTFRGPEGDWRQEQLDLMEIAPELGQPGMKGRAQDISKVLSHPSMEAAYPEVMAKLMASVEHSPGKIGGYYRAAIEEGPYGLPYRPEIAAFGKSSDDLKSVLSHELQHAVQETENFARGGSPKMFATGVATSEKGREILDDLKKSLGTGSLTSPREIVDNLKYFEKGQLEQIAAKHGLKNVNELEKFLKEETLQRDPAEQYRRLAGEAEARATQARRSMTMEQRRNTFPYLSYDVPAEELIIKR